MKTRNLILVLAALAFSAAVTTFLQWRLNARKADLHAQFRRQASLLAELNDRQRILSEAIRQRRARYEGENRELFCLRGEVSELRRDTVDPAKLKAVIQKLEEEIAAQKKPTLVPPDPQKVRAYWSREQLAFAGHVDQNAAIQTALWALTRGDGQTLDSIFTPEASKKFNNEENGPDPLLRQSNLIRLADSLRSTTGFYLVSDDLTPRIPEFNPDIHLFKIYFEGEGSVRGAGFRKIGNEWKFDGIYSIGGTDEKPTYELNLWP
jgi:hypothetical protein